MTTAAGFAAVFAIAALLPVATWLAWLARAVPRCVRRSAGTQPPVLVVVPLFDEAPLIDRKLANLAALDYPAAALRILLVDGGSSDGTVQRAERWIAGRATFELLLTSHRNKTAQLNEALRFEPFGEWILVTDADASLPADALTKLMALSTSDDRIGLAGVRVRPESAHELESLHWRATDWLREREFERGSAGIVAAPCYLARRELLAALPADTVADDVHVSCRAMLAGLRVGHADCTVLELRSPRTLGALTRHKFRKADAYLREVVRFTPRAFAIHQPLRAIFLWRAVLLTVVPLLAVAASIAAALALPFTALAIAFSLLLIRPIRNSLQPFLLAALLGAVSAAALVAYPFSRQGASFPKIVAPSEYELPDETS